MPTPTITPLALYGQPGASATLATAAAMVPVTGATGTTSHSSLVGTATGYGELTGLGTASAWAAAGALPVPTGKGFLWDAITLERQVVQGGGYYPTVRMSASVGSLTADIICRYSIRHGDGTYTTLATATATAQAITTTWTSYDLPGAHGLPTFCTTGDKIYCDLWLNITANSTGSGAATVSIGDLGNGGLGANGNRWVTPGFAVPMPSGVQWRVQLRDHNLVPLGELTRDPLDADLVLNFNDVGSWALTVRADDPLAASFAAGNGVIFSRDRGDGSGAQTILSGPIWHLERRLLDNVYVLAGPGDLWWLKARRADPVTVAGNYSAYASTLSGLLRYYRLGEASGTTATDSKSGVNGTYSATGVTYGVAPGIDDANTAVTLDGTAGRVSAASTSLPTGASAVSFGCWMKMSAYPTTSGDVVMELGNNLGGQSLLLFVDIAPNAGKLSVGTNSVSTPQTSPLALNVWHLVIGTYDGSNLRLYLDGVLAEGPTAAALNLTYGSLSIGSTVAPSNFFGGSVDEAFVCSGALDAATIAQLYARGLSRYAASAYDTRTNTASTVVRAYVDNNAGPSALSARRVFGLSLAADPAIGTSVTGNERFDNLLAACQQLALSGGDIGFKLVQSDVGTLTFTLYQPQTQSNAIFSRELGNLLDATYTLDGPVANQYVIGGSGEGTLRLFQTSQDSTSVSTWGLVEGFIDARDTGDVPTMQQRLSAQLAQDAQKTNLSITPTDTAALQFGRDYGLGDIVSVQIDSTTITDKIRQLHIQLNSTDQELITPGIGNAGAGQIAQLFDARQRALAAVQAKLARLQAAQ